MPLNLIKKQVAIDQPVVDTVFSLYLLEARKISYKLFLSLHKIIVVQFWGK